METPKKISTTEEKINSLRNSVTNKIKVLTHKGKKNKIGASAAQICIIIFSVATPILIGWKTTDNTMLTNIALICSAITAGGNMLFNFFDYKDLWIEYKISKNEFITLLAELDYLEASGIENIKHEQIDLLFQKYLTICLEIGKNYRRIRSTKNNNENKA
ncbi:SLATT domain-containing protein [Flavobacterium ajazii]|uniref:SLATT domain-containing protein n=1 Tax=Flavobacterium ajazii TaxID=2692318 RepID=UPI0013D882CC|nr:DUF4231 domain-containing protein [Flavobacterium ajazii]